MVSNSCQVNIKFYFKSEKIALNFLPHVSASWAALDLLLY